MKDKMLANMAAQPGGKAKGGKARAKALTKQRRKEIAKKGAAERWSPTIRTATHGDDAHPLIVGDIQIPCFVLDDGTRVFTQRGLFDALAVRSRGGEMERLIQGGALAESLNPDALQSLEHPIRFRNPKGGRIAYGYPVELLIDICNALLVARDQKKLPQYYVMTAVRAEVLVRAVAKVGIVALVDEVTGYQETRNKEALQALLDAYLRKELAAWAKRFPDDFYRELFRLRGWDWRGPGNSNYAVAHYTKDLVYARLAPALLAELEHRNPRIENRRKSKHHQWLTDDVGIPALAQHLHAVIVLQRASESWDQFMGMMNKALPVKAENLDLPLLEWGREQTALLGD